MQQKVIFTDFFNTIVRRNASPCDVIYNFCTLLGEKYSVEPSTLYKTFIKCKNTLATETFLKTGESEYTFEQIMVDVSAEIARLLPINENQFIADATECYINAEFASFSLKKHTLNLLKNFKNKGAKIVILSDFYCMSYVFKIWLRQLGVANLADDIIVSCEHGKSKRTGDLFDVALELENVSPKNALMLGDSKISDCRNAARHGIRYIYLKDKAVRRSKDLRQKIKYGANYPQLKEIFQSEPEYRFSNYAFPLYLFEKRLCKRLEEANIKNVFFLSREGQFLKTLFDRYCEITGKGFGITSHYIYVSRNSVLPLSLKPLGEESFDKVFRGVLCVTLRKFLTTLEFSEEEIEQIASELKVNPDAIYADMPHSAMFKKLCKNPLFCQKYEERRAEQAKIFDAYWESFGVDIYNEKIAVVDVGWCGTMQTLVDRHFNGRVNMLGFYVGARDRTKKDRASKFGLLYSRKNKTYKRAHFYRHNMTYYEQLLRANHNRTDSYAIIDGKPQPVLDKKIDDAAVFVQDIQPMQKMILSKFEQICKLDYDNCSVMDDIVARAFYKMSLRPTKKDWEWIMRCEDSHYDGFMRIGYTFEPYKHSWRLIVRMLERVIFALRNLGAMRIRVVTAKPQKESAKKEKLAAQESLQ